MGIVFVIAGIGATYIDYAIETANWKWSVSGAIICLIGTAPIILGIVLIQRSKSEITDDESLEVAPTVSTPKTPSITPAGPGNTVFLTKLPSTSSDLFGREKELKMLDEAWKTDTNVISLVAFGGVGKSALVNKWLNGMEKDHHRGAERVYGWSFYSQGTREQGGASADEFINAALVWFGDEDPTAGSAWDKGERLAGLVKAQRTLLILDGMEPIQRPPTEAKVGEVLDPALKCLIRELARQNPGLCVITTRVKVDDLKGYEEPFVKRVDLGYLSQEAGAQLLRNLGTNGTDDELKQAVKEVGGHALALMLLGRYLFDAHGGEIRKRDLIPGLTHEEEQGEHAKKVMDAYEKWFAGEPERDVLYVMGLFDRPAKGGAIETLRAEPAIDGLTDQLQGLTGYRWKTVLKHLRSARLLAPEDENEPETLDCHPLIREHFGQKLEEENPNAWKEAHSRLYEHYKSQPQKDLPDTIEEMAPLFAAVSHGCQAGRHQEALDKIYRKRVLRGSEFYSMTKLGAVSVDLAVLSGFFDSPWKQPVGGLIESDKGFVLHQAGFRLWALGRLEEAIEPIKAGLRLYIAAGEHKDAATAASNLRGVHVLLGNLTEALDYARKGVELADQSSDIFERVDRRTTLSNILHRTGAVQEATDIFLQAEKIQEGGEFHLPSFWYCELLIDKGQYDEAQSRSEKCLKNELRGPGKPALINTGVCRLELGRVCLLQAWNNNTGDFGQAKHYLQKAMADLRELGRQEFIVLGLLARAELHRVCGEFPQAQQDLDEAMAIATRGKMRLYEADCHLEYARLYLARGDRDSARESLDIAKKMIDEMGYHRRDGDVAELEGELAE